VPRIELRTEIAAPIETVFDLARSVDAHVASMSESRERAIAGITTGLIGLDDQVTWRATHFRVPFTMTSRIVAMDAPTHFVDEQVRGPFGQFHHEHRFVSVGDATEMIDTIEFSSPFGLLGRTVDRIGLERYLTNLIRVRTNTSRQLPRRKHRPRDHAPGLIRGG
jgi:ligand-binding SRPBCC domain-containing protein